MSDLILFFRSYRQTRMFGLPLLWTIKAAWQWRKLTPELIKTYETYKTYKTKVVLKGDTK